MPVSKCKWCGKEFVKTNNRQVCCCKSCQDERNRELAAKRQSRFYYKHKTGNVNRQTLTKLGSKGTTCTTKPKPDFEEEHKSIVSEAKRLGLNMNTFSKSLGHIVEETI